VPDAHGTAVAQPSAAYREAIGHFATGVTVITSPGERGPSGCTANAVCSLSLEPLLMLACLAHENRTLAAVRHSGLFGVNVLARAQEDLAIRFAGKGADGSKFRETRYRDEDGVPVLEGVVAWLTGRVRELLPGGDHVIAVGEVMSVGAPQGEPLLYHRGRYRSLGS